jgi:hypothetical protein
VKTKASTSPLRAATDRGALAVLREKMRGLKAVARANGVIINKKAPTWVGSPRLETIRLPP